MNEALPMEDAMNETPKTDAPEMEQADAAAPGAAAQSAGAAEAEAAERRALAKSVAEALIFASPEPLAQKAIADRLPSGTDVEALLAEIASDFAQRGIRLVRIAESWTFRTAPELAPHLQLERKVTRKLSRAALEALGIVAYHQPVTRAEIEDIRGVSMSKGTIDVLLETGWIRPRGRRKVPGRPITYGTTQDFVSHFGLEQLSDLPGLDELKGAGLLDGRLPPGFTVPMPSDDSTLREDEDPLEPGDLDLGLAPRSETGED